MRLRLIHNSPTSTVLTVAALLAVGTVCAGTAQAQGTTGGSAPQPAPEPTNTLDLTIDTGAPPSSKPAPAPSSGTTDASSASAGKTVVYRTLTGTPASTAPQVSRASQPLASRGTTVTREAFRQAPANAPRVLAQLGMVTSAQLPLRIERLANARVLSSVAQGTYLAVVADGGDWWGVLMVNNTMGWVPKQALQMIAYQTEIALAPTAESAAKSQTAQTTADNGAAGSVSGGVGENLDPRTTSLLREAMTYLGVPYVWAGNTRAGLDCSGFVKAVFASQGVKLPRHSGDQAKVGQQVSGPDIRPGDRLYFDMGRKGAVSHCGIYLGNGYFIHASTNHGKVDIDSVFKPNYYKALVEIRRS